MRRRNRGRETCAGGGKQKQQVEKQKVEKQEEEDDEEDERGAPEVGLGSKGRDKGVGEGAVPALGSSVSSQTIHEYIT